jgi:two-component system, chemotaxis family, CheB/CheR fusion protein
MADASHLIAIGGSAGALEALERFFRALPADLDASFVVVPHMDPHQKSHLHELLGKWCPLPVEVARQGRRVEPRHVYVREPGTILEVSDGHFTCRHEDAGDRERSSISLCLGSVAASASSRAVGVLLSGTGTDGTVGLRLIQEAGGRTLVQDPQEARFDAMPAHAVSAGAADRVLPAAELAREVARIVRNPGAVPAVSEVAPEIGEICQVLRAKTGHDFTSYKRSTVARRIDRRLQASGISSLRDYLAALEKDPAEARALLRDLLISVTQFFRDPDAFSVLQETVVPRLFDKAAHGDVVRVWIPACATGEEAYTIAILLRDHQKEHHPGVALQIFATDIDQEALDFARQGLYPLAIADHLPQQHLASYFRRSEKGYQTTQELREICIFSEHSLLKHPPFSRIDLISCRNLFIYWEPELQNRILPVFHYALNPSGFLMLGPAESVTAAKELFRVVDKKNRIFQRIPGVGRSHYLFPVRPE